MGRLKFVCSGKIRQAQTRVPSCMSLATPPGITTSSLHTLARATGTVVVEAKAGKGSATLSMAYAAARMAESTLLGLNGEPNIYECAFVASDVGSRDG